MSKWPNGACTIPPFTVRNDVMPSTRSHHCIPSISSPILSSLYKNNLVGPAFTIIKGVIEQRREILPSLEGSLGKFSLQRNRHCQPASTPLLI